MRTTTDILNELVECKRLKAKYESREAELFAELLQASANAGEVVGKSPLRDSDVQKTEQQTCFQLGRFLKGKFALVIWAACQLKAFVRTDGGIVKARDVANEIGSCLGIHFTEKEWKSTLEGNFHVNEPRSIFNRMAAEVWTRYLRHK